MKTILCIDLDDTLLAWTDKAFIEKSTRAICDSIRSIPPAECLARMEAAIRHIIRRTPGAQTLLELFYEKFCEGMDETQRGMVLSEINAFYRDEYHQLKQYTQPLEKGHEMVLEAFRRGYEVVIATNPLFPLTAIRQRLEWAGLGECIDRFLFITCMENSHFTKFDPAYYVELLGKTGWQEDTRVLLIGDSLEMDILPSSKAGMPSYWLSSAELPKGLNPFNACGDYDRVFDWVERMKNQPTDDLFQSRQVDFLAHLRAAPAIFDSICRSITDETGCSKPDDNEWSLVEIVCHLRDTDREVNLPRFIEAFQQENPFITYIDTSGWSSERNYNDEDGHAAAQEFMDVRVKIMELLKQNDQSWYTTTARHSIFGPVCVADLIQFIITHDQMHIRQAHDTLRKVKAQDRDASFT